MRALHISKSSEGAQWAVRQAAELVRQGVEVHVALPDPAGRAVPAWYASGAMVHFSDCALPVLHPAKFLENSLQVRQLIRRVNPDIIHCHHVATATMLRLVLGKRHRVPRVFQIAGPLHLEHWHSRAFEISLSGARDYWIGSSRFINKRYEHFGMPARKIFLSYHSADTRLFSAHRTGYLRRRLGIPRDAMVVGNINLIYPPKKFLGHKVGLKCHEDVIDAIEMVRKMRDDVWGVLVGGTFQGSTAYEETLRQRATKQGSGRILMPGNFSALEVSRSWPDFDCAMHVPLSENCGGVTEPLLCHVPTIAGNVGGLPEVIHPGQTGELVPVGNPRALAEGVLNVLRSHSEHKRMAKRGGQLVSVMFDPARCGQEIFSVYRHILSGDPRPGEFDAHEFLATGPAGAPEAKPVKWMPVDLARAAASEAF